tara:strand:- start:3440 stop:3958 length:519 start_codon:yes stop_codon:yes gene_type:complete
LSSRILVDEIFGKTANTTALTIDSTGRVQMPVVPAWRVGKTSNQDVSATGDTLITFNETDTDNCFLQGGVTLSSNVVTVPVAGVYQVNFVCRVDGIGSGYVVARLQKNAVASGNSDTYCIVGDGASGNYENLTMSDVFKADAGDNFRVLFYASNDNAYTINNNTTFSGHLVG